MEENPCQNCLWYKVIIMDKNMPRMDGAESTKKIIEHLKSKNRDPKNLPIIGLSAYTDNISKNECINAGMLGFTTKPLNKIKIKELMTGLNVLPLDKKA